MKYFTYIPQLESFESQYFKTDRSYFNLVRNMNNFIYSNDDKKFMKNFAMQFSDMPIDTSSIKAFVKSLWNSGILKQGQVTNLNLKPSVTLKKQTIGSLFTNVRSVAEKQKVNLFGASLESFFRFLLKNQEAIFGRKINTLDYDDLFEQYPQLVDVMSQSRVDTDVLEEDEMAGDRIWDKAKKSKSTGINKVTKKITGVYDPNIFKVVFLAGGPGSGKSAVAKSLFGIIGNFSYTGLKTVNSDRFFEYLLKKEGVPSDFRNMPKEQFEKITEGEGSIRERSKKLNSKQYESWLDGRLGLIIDGTGDNANKLISQAKFLKDRYGYDALMVFVNTTLNKAIERNNKRERKLPEKIVRDIWSGSQESLKKYKQYFGKVANTEFVEIDNSKNVNKIEFDRKIEKTVGAFLRKEPTNAKAKQWINIELKKKNKK